MEGLLELLRELDMTLLEFDGFIDMDTEPPYPTSDDFATDQLKLKKWIEAGKD